MASDEDLAWFAGLFEGEGCINICYRPNPSKKSRKPYYLMTRLAIKMTDLDTLEKVHSLFGGGLVPTKVPAGRKPCWTWTLGDKLKISSLGHLVFPYMSARRQLRLCAMFDAINDYLDEFACAE
jgi:hypothetical protein